MNQANNVNWSLRLVPKSHRIISRSFNLCKTNNLVNLIDSIWNHLVQITKDGNKTVIITTHYIEEARQAHTVKIPQTRRIPFFFSTTKLWPSYFQIGLMRSGRLLAEESPRNLLQMYNCPSLEDVFLKLSRKQGSYPQPTTELNISNNISLVSTLDVDNFCRRHAPIDCH